MPNVCRAVHLIVIHPIIQQIPVENVMAQFMSRREPLSVWVVAPLDGNQIPAVSTLYLTDDIWVQERIHVQSDPK